MKNYFTEMCSGSGAGSYLRLIDCVYLNGVGGTARIWSEVVVQAAALSSDAASHT